MTDPIPLFVELCAGTAAVSLRLHRDGAKPPVSRMGSKSGFASVVLRVLGLIPGQRAAAYLWCEPDPGVRLLLEAYRSATLAREAAAIIRGWAGEDPRALWERLRAEGPPRLPDGGAEAGEVARQVVSGHWAYRRGEPDSGFAESLSDRGLGGPAQATEQAGLDLPATVRPDARDVDPREVARWCQIVASNRLINVAWSEAEGKWINTGDGGATFGGAAFCSPPERTAEGLDGVVGDLPAAVEVDARAVDPREVARWAAFTVRTMPQAQARGATAGDFLPRIAPSGVARYQIDAPATGLLDLPGGLPAAITPDAREVDPGPALPPGTVAYMDPPYLNTTGYASDLPRADVVALARRWVAAGAVVAISEAEAIPELVAEGWHAVRIDGERVGQKRTFSKQQAEWLTLNRAPAWRPSVQGGLFTPR
jgi:hypothetical protein